MATNNLHPLTTSARPRVEAPADERVWVDQIRAGREEALEALMRAYYADLVDFAAVQVKSRSVAEELVQEIFLDIWWRGERWQPRGALRPFLYGAARKQCLMYFRTKRTRERREVHVDVDARSSHETPEGAFRYRELQRAVQEAIEALPERRRLVFKLIRHQGLSYAETAAVLDLSVNTVENQMVRATRFLRERLAGYLLVSP